MKTTPDNARLIELISHARTGKIVLPQFQRNFVWGRDDITALLTSILDGHFIGSFLLLRTDNDDVPFAIRPLQGVNIQKQLRPDWMILDGQQRLTSLHYVFAAPDINMRYTKYPYRFFLNLRKLITGEIEDAISSERADRVNSQLKRSTQFETLIIPFTEIETWNEWLNAYEQWLVDKDKDAYFNQYFKIDKPAWNKYIRRITDFLVPTIEIPKIPADDPDRIAEVCAIFEKMNSTGVRLSVYDLLTARMYRYGIDLHALWKETVENYDLIRQASDGEPDEYGVYTLRTIALLRGLDVKSKTLINLKPEKFADDWRLAVAYMEIAFKRIESTNSDGFGVFDRKWAPYSTMISPLAAMLYTIETKKLNHQAYKLARRWYWASVFRERYAGAVESTIYRDYQDFLKATVDESFEPTAISDARINIVENPNYSLRDVYRRNSIYRGIMCIVAIQGAKDFQADDSIEFHTLDDHHIFPKAFLRDQHDENGQRIPSSKINCILNRTLISSQTNRRISRSKPSQYLQKIVPADRKIDIMESHFINASAIKAMETDNFDAFLDAREIELLIAIHENLTN